MTPSLITPEDRAEYAAFIQLLADSAAPIAKRYFNSGISHELKADASPVTLADTEIEMELVAQIRTRYPSHGIFGEETKRINPDSPLQWVIDPIDGTRAFIAGKPTFVTLIALCENGVPQLGLISQPIQNKRWFGDCSCCHSREGGNNADLDPRLRGDDVMARATIATTSIPYFSAKEMALFQILEKKTSSVLLNLDGLAAGLMVDGQVDILLEAGLKPYDFAALVPVIEAAGGIATDWHGKPLTLASKGHLLAARNKVLHTQMLELLQG